MIERESTTRTSSVPSNALAAVRADWMRGGQLGRQVDAHDGVGARVGRVPERLSNAPGDGAAVSGSCSDSVEPAVELADAEVDPVGELLVAEPDRQRHDGDVELVGLVLGQVAGAVGDDADGHG